MIALFMEEIKLFTVVYSFTKLTLILISATIQLLIVLQIKSVSLPPAPMQVGLYPL